MNKSELITNLNSRVVKIIKAFAPSNLNGGDIEYSYTCLVEENGGFKEEDYSIRIVDEGLETESGAYVGGKQPPAAISREGMLKLRLAHLKTLGAFVMLDMTHLGVPFAQFKLDGAIKFAAELDGTLEIVDGE